jgi:hypothetical protein
MKGEDIIEIYRNSRGFNIIKAEGNDVVRLVELGKNKEKKVIDSYVYGKNGSFRSDTYVRKKETEYGESIGLEINFTGTGTPDKADAFYKFFAKSQYEVALIETADLKDGYGETIVMTDYKSWEIDLSNYAESILDNNPNSIITRMSHSHPSHGENYSSGFNKDLTPRPSQKGDRRNYLRLLDNPKYNGRVLKRHEIYIPGNGATIDYNDKDVRIKK